MENIERFTTEELNTMLYKKMFEEQEVYRNWLIEQKTKEILNHTYEYQIREDILLSLEFNSLTRCQAIALMLSPCPIDDIFREWNKKDTGYMSDIWSTVEERADRFIELNKENIIKRGNDDMYNTKQDVQKRVQEHYDWAIKSGYEVIGCFLQGSWNYGPNMTDEESDVDTKCLVVPNFRDFCLGKKMVSTTHVMENNEHVDLKDLRLYVNCFKKQNVNFVEILFTDYFVINPRYEKCLKQLFDRREEVARYNIRAALSCMVGMAYEKQKAMCHPYAGLKDKIGKYGYDGKQLSHVMRLGEMMEKYIAGEPYGKCLTSDCGKILTEIKRNKYFSLDDANLAMDVAVQQMSDMKNKYLDSHAVHVNEDLDEMFNSVIIDCMKVSISQIFCNECKKG
ncbi:DUF3848 domain-containing protein [Anaerovoracaceae bacterium 41-7]